MQMAGDATEPDVASMLRLQNGDDLALNEIMTRWQTRLRSHLFRLTGDQSVADDLAEETFVRVYQGRARYRPTAAFSTWLFAIAANLFRDLARWKQRHPTVTIHDSDGTGTGLEATLSDPHPDAAVQLVRTETAAAVRDAVLSLPEEQRQAIVLSEYEGLSHEEIGQITKCSPKAVESRLYRARAILREKLRAKLGGE